MGSPIYRAGSNWSSEAAKLTKSGVAMPRNPTQARQEAMNVSTSVANRSLIAALNREKLANYRTGANMQVVQPKQRTPMGTLGDQGVPHNVEDPEELVDIRRWCNSPQAPVWMADYTFKPIGEIEPGDQVIGWETVAENSKVTRTLTKATVLATKRRVAPEVVRLTLESGRTIECTPDHHWLQYTRKDHGHWVDSKYAPAEVGSVLRNVVEVPRTLSDEEQRAAWWLAGMIDSDGSFTGGNVVLHQSNKVNSAVVQRIDECVRLLGVSVTRVVLNDERLNNYGYSTENMVMWTFVGGRQALVDLKNWADPVKLDAERMDSRMLTSRFGHPDAVVSVESLGPGEVISMQTTTENYVAWGTASRNCRLFYATHDLVPLLIDIYSKFPVVGLEFDSKDPMIKRFYEDMFLGGDLNYLEFLPDQFGREYFTVGEVTSMGHFNESLAVWTAEEILNPDQIRVSRSLFVQRERVQLMVEDLVENLRRGPMGAGGMSSTNEETPSERKQRTDDYEQIARYYPEIVQAAMQKDGLDISDALIGRVVNRNTPWATRGTPHLLRSFRTLMTEESLNAAQNAVADRLYSPMILATLGTPDLGDGEPWIPDQTELEDVREMMQAAFAADFRFVAYNFGMKIESVFGRESVPNLDNDFQRIDAKLLQAWGIGEALISGGTGGAYASSALNREFVTQMMVGFQNALRRFIIKRAEVVAEAQGHFDYDLKGGRRIPIYREIVITDEETGREYIKKVPKLLIPDVKFSTLNLRDEAQERAFIAQLKAMGVPVSDKTLAVNIDMEFKQELERQADESVEKLMATAQTMKKVQDLCDLQNLPYPPELAQHLMSTLQLRQGMDQTKQLDAQTPVAVEQAKLQLEQIEMQEAAMEQQMAMGGPMAMMPPGGGGQPMPPGQEEAPVGGPGGAPPQGQPPQGQMDPNVGPGAPGPGAPAPGSPPAGYYASLNYNGPQTSPPTGMPPSGGTGPELPPGIPDPTEVPRNRQRPPESDDMRQNMPKTGRRKRTRSGVEQGPRRLSKFEVGPSTYHVSHEMTEDQVEEHVARREAVWRSRPARQPQVSDLVNDPDFYRSTNMGHYQSQLQADWPEILNGGAKDSRRILDDMVAQYEQIYGVEPQW